MSDQGSKTAEKALRLRQRLKRRKPDFVRPESWRYVRIKKNWRRPQGLDHKMRIKYKGWPPTVNIGYRGPKKVRGFHPSGCQEVLVYNAADLEHVDPKTQVARIAHTVGKRKRTQILVEAKKKKIRILNAKQAKEPIAEEEHVPVEEKLEEEAVETETPKEAEKVEKPKPKARKAKKSKGAEEKP